MQWLGGPRNRVRAQRKALSLSVSRWQPWTGMLKRLASRGREVGCL